MKKLPQESWEKDYDKEIKNIIDSGWTCCDKDGDGCNCYERASQAKVKAIKNIIHQILTSDRQRVVEEVLLEMKDIEDGSYCDVQSPNWKMLKKRLQIKREIEV